MFYRHPVLLAISSISAFSYNLMIQGKKAALRMISGMAVIFLLSAVVNPLFSHEGMTIVGYFSTGNPITVESILFGLSTGAMLVTVLLWFVNYHEVMTSDKFIYLFGKSIPTLSLILTMTLRFVPKFQRQIKKVAQAQQGVGRNITDGKLLERTSHGIRILSIMTTWALESSVDTADSMRARGYGLRGRTNYSIYHFERRDKMMLAAILILTGLISIGIAQGALSIQYYPVTRMNGCTPQALAIYIAYGILCLLPIIVNLMEDIKWHYMRSKI